MFLDRILAVKRKEAAELKDTLKLSDAERIIAGLLPCRGFRRALTAGKNRKAGLIAEVKKASPSKGLIRPDFDPANIAQAYERAGADCISVLTDRAFFQGSNEVLREVRANVGVPLLRKDFIIDERQIYEARIIGADAVLLIAACLAQEDLRRFLQTAKDLGLDALLEVHDRAELERALELEADIIGINNRNLKTFVTDLRTTGELAVMIPDNRTLVSESGIAGPGDLAYLRKAGAQAFLIGEHFMRQQDIERAVRGLMDDPAAGIAI